MVQKAAFRGWMVEAYKEGRIQDIPEHLREIVADIARRQAKTEKEESQSDEAIPFGDAQE